MLSGREFIEQQKELASFLTGADHVDVKTVPGRVELREFVAALLAYSPVWLKALYWLRGLLAVVLGLEHEATGSPDLMPDQVPMIPGEKALFWTVVLAEEGRYWVVEAADRHLAATLVVAFSPPNEGPGRYHLATVVHYRHWTGPVYFNLIRPFHHLVVAAAARAAARGFNTGS